MSTQSEEPNTQSCHICEQEISKQEEVCPNCGSRIRSYSKVGNSIAFLFFAFFAFAVAYSMQTPREFLSFSLFTLGAIVSIPRLRKRIENYITFQFETVELVAFYFFLALAATFSLPPA